MEKGIAGIRMSEQTLQGKEQVILTRRICAVPGFQAAAGKSCQGFASPPKFLGCLRPRSDPVLIPGQGCWKVRGWCFGRRKNQENGGGK